MILSNLPANSEGTKLPVMTSMGAPLTPIKYEDGIISTGSDSS